MTRLTPERLKEIRKIPSLEFDNSWFKGDPLKDLLAEIDALRTTLNTCNEEIDGFHKSHSVQAKEIDALKAENLLLELSDPEGAAQAQQIRALKKRCDELIEENKMRFNDLQAQMKCNQMNHEGHCKLRDELRDKLDIAGKALEIVVMHDPNLYDDKTCAGFMLVNYNYCKEVLSKILGEKG